MKRSAKNTYLLAVIYGIAMASVGAPQSTVWIGATYALLIGLNEHYWGRK